MLVVDKAHTSTGILGLRGAERRWPFQEVKIMSGLDFPPLSINLDFG